MPGVKYDSAAFAVEKELYRIDTAYRLSGGFNPASGEVAKLAGQTHIPVLCPLFVDLAARTFVVVQNCKVYEAADAAATSLKIAKGSFVQESDVLLVGVGQSVTVSAIDKSKADVDTLTVSALSAALSAGDTIEAETASYPVAEHVANFANYDRRKIESGMSITAIGQAYEIDEANLDIPFSDADKAGVTDRFMFI